LNHQVYLPQQHLNEARSVSITPAELVATVAAVLGIPYAGLRTKKGHGRGSALMGAEDAAVLLAAIASCDEIRRAADCVQTLYALPFAGRTSNHRRNEYEDISFLCGAIGRTEKEVNTFGKAIVAIMHHLIGKADSKHYFGFDVWIAGGAPQAAELIITTPKKTRRIEFYRKGEILKTVDACLIVKRQIIGSAMVVVSNVLAERSEAA
jgi:hypothetical protein